MKVYNTTMLALVAVLGFASVELCNCNPLKKRTITPEMSWTSKGKLSWDKVKTEILPLLVNNEKTDSPYEDDIYYDTKFLGPSFAGYGDVPEESPVHPWRDYHGEPTGEGVHKAYKRASLQDLLKSLRIQGAFRFKPMRFGAGVGRK